MSAASTGIRCLVVDAFDAMTSGRPSRGGPDPDSAVTELRRHRGTQFDGDVVEASTDAFPDRTLLPLSTPRIRRRHLPRRIIGVDIPQTV